MKEVSGEVLEVIKEAIKLEINGRAFFDSAASQTENEMGKKMFKQLARDEIAHLNTFKKMFTSAVGDDWKKAVDEKDLEGDPTLIDELTLKVEKEEKKGELGAIRIGMELEKSAIDFFTQAAEKTSDPAAKEIFEKIAEEEKTHYDLLQAQYDHVTQSGFWFDIGEFRMDGKY